MDDDNFFLDDSADLPVEEASDEIEQDAADFEQQTEESTNEPESVEETQTPEPETPQERMLRLKVDREEKEVPESEAIRLAQIGMNQDRAIARAKQEARDTYIKEQGYTWNDKPITNEAEYKQALAEQKMIEQYKDRDLPPEVIQELVESRRDREERQREKQEKAEQEKQQAAFAEFFNYFESANERKFDPKTDTLPQEVIDMAESGVPLKYAYMDYHNRQLRNSLKVAKQNKTNSEKAPVGSVTSNGSVDTGKEDDWFSKGLDNY
jgi:hypothetical protein